MKGDDDAMAQQNQTPGRVCAKEYTVRRGDSFYLISHRLGIPLKDLLAANTGVNPARLMVGDVLCIPTEDPCQHIPQPYTPAPMPEDMDEGDEEAVPSLDVPAVMPGENEPVDPQMGVCPQENRLTVTQGQTLADIQITHQLNRHSLSLANPGVDLENLTPGQTLCIPQSNTPCPLPTQYTLGAEENLEKTAMKFNLSLGALLKANPCLAPADFVPGMCIRLPE